MKDAQISDKKINIRGDIMTKECPIDMEAALKRIEGDQELFEIIIDAFLKEWPSDMESLSQHISSGNYEELERIAHRTKGAVSAIGAETVKELLADLENMGKKKNMDSAEDVFGNIKKELKKIKNWADTAFNKP